MKISVITLFPEMFSGPFDKSIIKRAREKGLVSLNFVNLRNFGIGKHQVVDDRPFGGGLGMVLRVDILDKAIEYTRDKKLTKKEEKCILLDARGHTFSQQIGVDLSHLKHLILICGHYEGVDERVRSLVDEILSIGDFIVTGGEIPAMLIIDNIVRLIPKVLKEDATSLESFSQTNNAGKQLLEYPQYTLPRIYKNMSVPEILLSGNHAKIKEWKKEQAIELTKKYRPDLFFKKK